MSGTKQLWLGLAVLAFNGFHAASGVLTGEVGGFGGLVNPDRLPSLDYEPGWYFAIIGLYLVLTWLGIFLIVESRTPSAEPSSEGPAQ